MIIDYGISVIGTYVTKLCDGTLKAARTFGEGGGADGGNGDGEHLIEQREKYIALKDTDTRTYGVREYSDYVEDNEAWQTFVAERLEPCFDYVENLRPFETIEAPEGEHGDGDDDETAFQARETHIAPDQIIKLGLAKIERQFPSAGAHDLGDRDIRQRISANTRVFYHNYRQLSLGRIAGVACGMAWLRALYVISVLYGCAALALLALAAPAVLDGLRSNHVQELVELGMAVKADEPSVFLWLLGGFGFLTGLMLVTPWAVEKLVQHWRKLHTERFSTATAASSATVSKAIMMRQEALVSTVGGMFEQTRHGREEAWNAGREKLWTSQTGRWTRLIFWIHGRIAANQEYMRIHMKLIGMMYVGLRAKARMKALALICGRVMDLTVWLVIALAAATVALAWPAGGAVVDPKLVVALGMAQIVLYGYVLGWTVHLHTSIKAVELPRAINAVVKATSTQYIKGTRDARIDLDMAANVNREKLRLQMEEDKRRH